MGFSFNKLHQADRIQFCLQIDVTRFQVKYIR